MTVGTGRRRKPAARTTDAERDRARDARLIAAVREHDDPEALHALVAENLGLVRRIARRHAAYGEQVDDLVQEGMVGLLKAIRRFDRSEGCRSPRTRAAPSGGRDPPPPPRPVVLRAAAGAGPGAPVAASAAR